MKTEIRWHTNNLRALHSKDPNELDALGHSGDLVMRIRVAGNPCTPTGTCTRLVEEKDHPLVLSTLLSRRPPIPEKLVQQIEEMGVWRSSSEHLLRCSLAANPHTSKEVLEELWRGENMDIHLAIICRTACPGEFAEIYAHIAYEAYPKTVSEILQQQIRLRARRVLGLNPWQ